MSESKKKGFYLSLIPPFSLTISIDWAAISDDEDEESEGNLNISF